MKVLMISGAYPPMHDGVGAYTRRIVESLQIQGINVKVFTHQEADSSDFVENSVTRWSFRDSFQLIVKNIKTYQPNIIHLQYPSTKYSRWPFINLLPLILKMRFRSIPVVVTVHEYHNASTLGKIRVRMTLLGANRVVVSNDQDLESLGITSTRIKKIRIGNNILKAAPSASKLGHIRKKYSLGSKKMIGFVGFIDEKKGIEMAIEATAKLGAEYALILLANDDQNNPYHQSLHQRISESGAEVHWPGFLPDDEVSQLIQGCEAMIFPFTDPVSARRGSFFTSLIHGRPTIAHGLDNDVFVNGKNCLLIPEMNATKLSEAISSVLGDSKLADKLSKNAAKVAPYFDWKNIAQEHIKLYKEISI